MMGGCGGDSSAGGDGSIDMGASSGGAAVAINELFAHGSSAADPDWAELKNLGSATLDLSGYSVRDKKTSNLTKLPSGTTIAAGGYLVILCSDEADGGVPDGLYVPFGLSGDKGDEFHLLDAAGVELDSAAFADDVPSDKSWGRLPDGTGSFIRLTPSRGASNL